MCESALRRTMRRWSKIFKCFRRFCVIVKINYWLRHVRPSFRPHRTNLLPPEGFLWYLIYTYMFFRKYFEKIQLSCAACPLKIGPIGCPETSKINYQSTMPEIPGEREYFSHTAVEAWNHAPKSLVSTVPCRRTRKWSWSSMHFNLLLDRM